MTTSAFRALKTIAKRLTVLLVTVVMLLSLTQMAALAGSSPTETKSGSTPSITEPVPGESISEKKEQRREWQNKASSLKDDKETKPGTLGGTLKEKLNLEEITEGYDPEKEAAKRSLPTP